VRERLPVLATQPLRRKAQASCGPPVVVMEPSEHRTMESAPPRGPGSAAIDEPIRPSPLIGRPLPLQRVDQLRLVAFTHLDRVVVAEVHVVLRVRWIELEPRG